MKILMIHGPGKKLIQRGLGPLQPGAELVYPTAPFSLGSSGGTSELRDRHGAWTWFETESIDGLYHGLEGGLSSIGSILKHSGPSDGVVGFSEGAAAAAMVASLLEKNRKDAFDRLEAEGGIPYPSCFATLDHPPLKFVVNFSGYTASHPAYRAFYDPSIRTPTLHFLGSMDNVVDENASMRLVESCQELEGEKKPIVIWHAGGHVVPSGKRELAAVVHFIKSNGS
ncbi:Eukaryotic translation initiation factor 6 [Penicillium atrosanguineum]|uniref:Eukaryotic translation initiation factor 6 n=1 Tax=Penicillium atrosanguineum TaxID=1132637 RepID=UPI002388E1DE|nr:Eukaryotic translation initiation factor 6 [Penicillium atrosanguineum]KAJ5293401.1 Eukaryotic translation initiation factor 6 [Penicillium atrosanguineum]